MMIPTTASDYEVNDITWQAETRVHIDQVTVPENRVGADRYSDSDLRELVASILANGLIQPITVNVDRELVSGLNRLRAFRHITHTLKIPGYVTIPARTVNADGDTQVIVEAHENIVRRDLADKDSRAMVERARQAGMSRTAAIKHVAELTGRPESELDQDVRLKDLERDVEAAVRSGNPREVAAAKEVSRLLANKQTRETFKEGRRIMAAARTEGTAPAVPSVPAGRGERPVVESEGATVTDLTARATVPAAVPADATTTDSVPAPAKVALTSGQAAWRRHFLLIAQEAAALEAMDEADAAAGFAALPVELQEQVRATAAALTRVLDSQVEAAA